MTVTTEPCPSHRPLTPSERVSRSRRRALDSGRACRIDGLLRDPVAISALEAGIRLHGSKVAAISAALRMAYPTGDHVAVSQCGDTTERRWDRIRATSAALARREAEAAVPDARLLELLSYALAGYTARTYGGRMHAIDIARAARELARRYHERALAAVAEIDAEIAGRLD